MRERGQGFGAQRAESGDNRQNLLWIQQIATARKRRSAFNEGFEARERLVPMLRNEPEIFLHFADGRGAKWSALSRPA
jgi:hypothetical protein